MQRKRTVQAKTNGWTYEQSARVNGRVLTPGTEVSVRGERGRFRFRQAVTTDTGCTWLDFIGGQPGHEMFRSFHADRIRTVHTSRKARP